MWRRASAATLVLTASAVLLLVGSAPAWACSCAPLTSAQKLQRADVIFSGRVVSTDDSWDVFGAEPLIGGVDTVTWTVAVERVYRGSARASQEIVTARVEATCGYPFRVGRNYLVLADTRAEQLTTGMCSGTRPLSAVSDRQQAQLGAGWRPASSPGADQDSAGTIVTGIGIATLLGLATALWVRRRRRGTA